MENKAPTPDVLNVLRNTDSQSLVQRLHELEAERSAVKTLLRAVVAKERMERHSGISKEGRRDD